MSLTLNESAGLQRLTFVIPNYNYGTFVGRAIRSALDVDWPDVEVIVVDDGSTDNSIETISEFEGRIRIIRQPNQGPRTACNAGFAASTGDWVIFLDSDDLVSPEVALAIDAHDRPGLSKIQFQMRRIDISDRPVGSSFPKYRRELDPELIRYWMRTTASYPTPPGSGNAYTRGFLNQLFPLDDRCGDATDSACLAAAPFLGDVVTVNKPVFSYRVHGNNRSYLLADVRRFESQLLRALQRHRFAQQLDGRIGDPKWMQPLFRGRHLLQLRIAHRRLTGEASPLPGDSFSRMLYDSLRNTFSPGPEFVLQKVIVAIWCVSALLLPRRAAQKVIRLRFVQPGTIS